MCLVVAFSNSKKLDVRKTANVIGPMLLNNEPDGFGYSVLGKKGQFGEKFVGEDFRSRIKSMHLAVQLPIVKKQHSMFGEVAEPVGPAIFHGRTSTNDNGLRNCHPMLRDGWSLIHNGVVTDHGDKYKKLTTNDSEDVLARLILGIDQVEKHLSGYYAFAAIDPEGKLHVARDGQARLFTAWSGVIESYIFATKYQLIADISRELNLRVGPIDAVEDNVYLVLDGNEQVHHQTINPRGYSSRESRHAKASLGRSLTSVDEYAYGEVYQGGSAFGSEFTVKGDGNTIEGDSKEGWPSEAGTALEQWGEEKAYYALRHELESIDDTYTIFTNEGNQLTADEFKKLDHITQEMCLIERSDGTIVEMEYWQKAD